jgi:hypothetical protein
MSFTTWYWSSADVALLPASARARHLAGLWPAIQAYRLGLLTTLKPQS